ncbi:MAG TPA: carboxypeptidase-like regulatory domain-containing protein, partial [Gemmataceae bacterium]|nr:carboxypeptidase-like regulatory domain-containing protein [Gemmataceae bacterium]
DPGLADVGDVRGFVTLSADGYERAFRFQVTFSGSTGTIKSTLLDAPAVWLVCPEYGVPGVPLPVRVGVDNIGKLAGAELTQLDTEVNVRLELGQGEGKAFDPYSGTTLKGHRRQRVAFDLAAAEGAVGYRTEVGDWLVDLATRGVFGKNSARARGVDADDKAIAVGPERDLETVAPVMLDATPPSILKGSGPDADRLIAGVPPRLVKGRPLPVVARVKEPPSGVRSVAFVTDKLVPDPKTPGALVIPEGAARVPGKHREKEDKDGVQTWEAVLAEVPTDKKGKVEVVVEVVSNAGLKDLGRFEVALVDAPPAAAGATTGSIKGRVLEGGRAQPDMLVILKDVGGNIKADATTNDAGEYEFKDLPPGPYVVSSAKSKSATKGDKTVQVKAGKEAPGDINLLR